MTTINMHVTVLCLLSPSLSAHPRAFPCCHSTQAGVLHPTSLMALIIKIILHHWVIHLTQVKGCIYAPICAVMELDFKETPNATFNIINPAPLAL
jgi:hypothetical protein